MNYDMEHETKFVKTIEELIDILNIRKDAIKKYLMKNFLVDKDYTIEKISTNEKRIGGQNKEIILMTKNTFDLTKSTYNLNHKYVQKVQNVEIVDPLLMRLETSYLTFIENIYEGIYRMKREYRVENYRIDLYIFDLNLAIECDEGDHKGYNCELELKRQQTIESLLGCQFIRFNPCAKDFTLCKLINDINKVAFRKNQT